MEGLSWLIGKEAPAIVSAVPVMMSDGSQMIDSILPGKWNFPQWESNVLWSDWEESSCIAPSFCGHCYSIVVAPWSLSPLFYSSVSSPSIGWASLLFSIWVSLCLELKCHQSVDVQLLWCNCAVVAAKPLCIRRLWRKKVIAFSSSKHVPRTVPTTTTPWP